VSGAAAPSGTGVSAFFMAQLEGATKEEAVSFFLSLFTSLIFRQVFSGPVGLTYPLVKPPPFDLDILDLRGGNPRLKPSAL